VEGGVDPNRITLVPSALEPPPAGSDPVPPPPESPFRVGTLAALTPQKDPRTWLRTVDRVCDRDPTIRFVWAGDGELARRTEVALREAGREDRAQLLGFRDDPETFWREIDLFFLPSAFEALGTVLLDAMARGFPIVATAVGGIPETVRDGREGLLAPAGDAEALAAAILRIREDPGLYRDLGTAGRERSREYEVEPLVDRVEAIYRRLTTRTGGGSPC
jgi:glycosyltransferase involved in cell wall biosynthesis